MGVNASGPDVLPPHVLAPQIVERRSSYVLTLRDVRTDEQADRLLLATGERLARLLGGSRVNLDELSEDGKPLGVAVVLL